MSTGQINQKVRVERTYRYLNLVVSQKQLILIDNNIYNN